MYKKLHGVRLPLEGHLDLTYRCNNNCRHCYINLPANDKEAKGKELSLEEISAIANEAVSMGAVWCLITGGEPLLREDFADIYLSTISARSPMRGRRPSSPSVCGCKRGG